MRPLFFVYHLALFTTALAVNFINPSPFVPTNDFSSNPSYPLGSTEIIQWTPGPDGIRTSLTLFQLNGTQFLQPFEYLTQNVFSNVTSFIWNVQTIKNLTFSNMFFLSLFLEGVTNSENNCHYFNITGSNVDKPTSSTSTSTSTTTSSTGTSTSTTTSSASVASTSVYTTSTTAYPTSPPSGLSTGAKAGIGIGTAVAVALGISAGWFIFGRRKKQYVSEPAELAMRGSSYEAAKGNEESYQLSAESPVVSTTHELHDSPQQHHPQQLLTSLENFELVA